MKTEAAGQVFHKVVFGYACSGQNNFNFIYCKWMCMYLSVLAVLHVCVCVHACASVGACTCAYMLNSPRSNMH